MELDKGIIEACARAAHEANRTYCQAMGDDTQDHWEDAPFWQRNSMILGAMAVLVQKLTPEQTHEKWCETKYKDGWKHGPVKDVDKKEHPCLVPYVELPPDQQRKDKLFGTVVRAMYEAITGEVP